MLRMSSLKVLFQKLERIVCDLSAQLGKKIKIVLEGGHIELDKTIIEKISDPLVHIVRNSVDHGIESAEVRAKKGRPEEGTIKIMAQNNPSGVSITVRDDGKGMDREKIYAKAVKIGLIKAGQVLEESQINALIFAPGFSTNEVITEISGRGVGMDVVKRTVDSVGGTVSLTTKVDVGTTLVINLPTSLSIINGLVVMVDQSRFVVPLNDLAEIIDLQNYQVEAADGDDTMVNLRGKVVPISKLSKYFPSKNNPEIPTKISKSRPALVLETSANKVGFLVDEIIGQQQIVVRPFNAQLSQLSGLCASTVMADGEAGVIIGLKDIAEKYVSHYGLKGVDA